MSRFIRIGKRTIHTVSPKEVKRAKRCVKKAEGMISKIAVKATKGKPLPPAPPTLDYTVEICNECGETNVFCWNIKKDGYAAHCLYCGEPLILCSACKDREDLCDWNDEAQACHRCREQTDCERCAFAVEYGDGESWHCECRHPDANEIKITNTIGNCELFEPNA